MYRPGYDEYADMACIRYARAMRGISEDVSEQSTGDSGGKRLGSGAGMATQQRRLEIGSRRVGGTFVYSDCSGGFSIVVLLYG